MIKYIIRSLFAILVVLSLSLSAIAQPPPPDYDEDGDQQPAPICSGMVILLAMGTAYAAKKVYKARKKELRE